MVHVDIPLSDTPAKEFADDEVNEFRLRTGWIDDQGVIIPGRTQIERRGVSWWKDHELIVATDPDWGSNMAAWVQTPKNKLVRLDGTSPPIHALNAESQPVFTEENVMPYLGFFCFFVLGGDGPFYVVDDLEAGFIPDDLADEYRDAIEEIYRKPKLLKVEEPDDGQGSPAFHLESLIYYANAVFLANFKVEPTGMVEMLDDEPLIADMNAKVGVKLRFKDEEEEEQDAEEAEEAEEVD